MRRLGVPLLLSAALVPAFGDTGSAQQLTSERLRGGNENPPVISDGSGNFRWRSGDGAFRLRYDVATEDSEAEEPVVTSDATQAHLHIGNPGTNGGIVVFLCSNLEDKPDGVPECPPSPGEVTGDITVDDVLPVGDIIDAGDLEGLVRLARQGAVYVNVHTEDHASGEVRGQMSPRRR